MHIAPAIQKDIKTKYEAAGWTKPEDWPAIAEAILDLLHWCNEDPELLSEACAEFAQLPYSKGFQTGMLTPILNALRPEAYLLINDKSRRTINHFSAQSHGPKIVPAGYALVEGGKLKAGMLVRDIGGNAQDGSVPTGENVVEEIMDVLPTAPSRTGREYVNLVLRRMDTGTQRTKYLSEAKRVFAKVAADPANCETSGLGTRPGALTDYPALNVAGWRLIEEFAGELDRPGAPDLSDADRFDMFSHWLVAVRKYHFQDRRYKRNAPGAVEETGPGGDFLFSAKTFDLLAGLHENPTKTYYQEHRDGMRQHVEEPFQRLVRGVAQRLPAPITGLMEIQQATGENVELAYVDQGCMGERASGFAAEHGIRLEVVKHEEAKRGFVLLPRRWVVECDFAWASRFRRLVKDCERLPETVAGLHFVAFACLFLQQAVGILSAGS